MGGDREGQHTYRRLPGLDHRFDGATKAQQILTKSFGFIETEAGKPR